MSEAKLYATLLADIQQRIQRAQTRAALAVNAELIYLYWQIGQILAQQQTNEFLVGATSVANDFCLRDNAAFRCRPGGAPAWSIASAAGCGSNWRGAAYRHSRLKSLLQTNIQQRIQRAQTRAALAVNAELIYLYWQIGQVLAQQQASEGWGAGVIPRLARDLKHELPEVKGFSARNLDRMLAFARAYPEPALFSPQLVAKLNLYAFSPQPVAKLSLGAQSPPSPATEDAAANAQSFIADSPAINPHADSLLWQLPWGHHALLLEKLKDHALRTWYMAQTLNMGWSRNTLALQIDSQAHARQGQAVNNFSASLPAPQSDLVRQALKDPYVLDYLFDFLTLEASFHERELETGLILHLEKFLLELGQGFAFVGRQYPLTLGNQDFYLDLLFYHLKLRAFVVIELKRGDFQPEFAGKLNFYCNLVDDSLRHTNDAPTIGLLLCQSKDNVLAEYAVRGIDKPIGIASYQLTRALPDNLQSALPSIEAIEAELSALSTTISKETP